MDIKQLVRNADKVKAALKELPDGRLITTTGCKIIIPCRFEEKGMARIGIDNSIVGIYAMVVEDLYYAVSMVNAMLNIDPSATERIKIDGDDHYVFTFIKGATVFKSVNLIKMDSLVYRIYDEVFSKGRVPWYLNYNDLAGIFDTAKKHAGAGSIGKNREVTELIVSMVARDPKDRTKYYRTAVKSMTDVEKAPPAMISLRDVSYAPGTLNKLAGSYMSVGVVAALVEPGERTERIESLLRM
jgi:hypothetical protein